nr:hypothetical protein [Mycoplasmopsis caviae]
MLSLKYILENEKKVKVALKNRNFDLKTFNELIKEANKRGKLMFEAQSKKAELTKFSKEFAKHKNDKVKLSELQKQVAIIKKNKSNLKKKLKTLKKRLMKCWLESLTFRLMMYHLEKMKNKTKF